MYIKNDMDFNDLMENCWCGAIDTLKTIEKNDIEEEFMEHLEEVFGLAFDDNIPTLTEINDYIRFEWEEIYKALGISETEDDEEEDEEEDDSIIPLF